MAKLSYRQIDWLRRLAKEPWVGSNTNSTMEALERRGLVDGVYNHSRTFCLTWTITAAGRAHLEGLKNG